MPNLAKHIPSFEDKDDWMEYCIERLKDMPISIFGKSAVDGKWAKSPMNFYMFVRYPMEFTQVEIYFRMTRGHFKYSYDTRCVLHLLEHIFAQLNYEFTKKDFQKAAYDARDTYTYDGSVYLIREDREALQIEMTTCQICGARGDTNAYNTCDTSDCLDELNRILEGM